MKDHGMPNFSDTVRTILTYAAKDFEAYLQAEKGDAEEEEEEPANLKVMPLMLKFFEELSRQEAGRGLQNPIVPGIPPDLEPALNRLGEGQTDSEPFGNGYSKTPQNRDNTYYLRTNGRV